MPKGSFLFFTYSSECVVFTEQLTAGVSQPDSAVTGYNIIAYLFTDGVEDAVNKIRSARAKLLLQ